MDYGLGSTASVPNWTDSSYDIAVTAQTVANDIVSAVIPVTSVTNDGWSDWFKKLGGAVVDYSIKKDAAQTGSALMYRPQTGQQPTYVTQGAAAAVPVISNQLLLIGAAVAAVMLLKK